jgi:hypothetical protein
MFEFDDSFLESVGLGSIPVDQKQSLMQHIMSELEIRVGTRLSEGLNDEELKEFEKFSPNSQDAYDWLVKHRPNFAQIVSVEIEKLQKETASNKDHILTSLGITA